MAFYIAHARSNEMGQTVGGQAGDQTGHEVEISEYFEYEWTDVFRPKKDADKYAEQAKIICQNDAVGYDHNDRYSLWDLAKERGWDFRKVTTPVNTDCSCMVSAICNSLGIPVNRWMWTGSQIGDMEKVNAFEHFAYTDKSVLKNGDILLTTRKGHTGTVISDGVKPPTPTPTYQRWVGEAYGLALIPVYKEPKKGTLLPEWSYLGTGNLFEVHGESGDFLKIWIAGQYYGYIESRYCLRKTEQKAGTVSTDLHLRQNAGSGYKSLCIMPKGAVVEICDTKKAATGADWHYVKYNGQYGFCSARYVK